MGKCANHPEIETGFKCLKHGTCLCRDCLECRDPELYCTFRPACPIAFMEKSGEAWGEAN